MERGGGLADGKATDDCGVCEPDSEVLPFCMFCPGKIAELYTTAFRSAIGNAEKAGLLGLFTCRLVQF